MPKPMTSAEKVRDGLIRELGCIACYVQTGRRGTPACSHHITRRGRRLGHTYTIPLCNPGHHKDVQPGSGKEPFHHNKETFEDTYGTQDELFALTNKLIGYTDEMIADMAAPRPAAVRTPRKSPPKGDAKARPSHEAAVIKRRMAQKVAKERYLVEHADEIAAKKAELKARAKQFQNKIQGKSRIAKTTKSKMLPRIPVNK